MVLPGVKIGKLLIFLAVFAVGNPVENAVVLYASIKKGYAPIVGAIVEAYVSHPNGNQSTIRLLDNGAGADLSADDGIYSRFFYNYSGNGIYNAQFKTWGQSETCFVLLEERELVEESIEGEVIYSGTYRFKIAPVFNFVVI